ncbi:MAG: PA14 domain-containing protein [Candidatus Sericytochromatia bacterium]|nr:PA14 domain-containing protein [Candidatus Sericytochromatia bacterium]
MRPSTRQLAGLVALAALATGCQGVGVAGPAGGLVTAPTTRAAAATGAGFEVLPERPAAPASRAPAKPLRTLTAAQGYRLMQLSGFRSNIWGVHAQYYPYYPASPWAAAAFNPNLPTRPRLTPGVAVTIWNNPTRWGGAIPNWNTVENSQAYSNFVAKRLSFFQETGYPGINILPNQTFFMRCVGYLNVPVAGTVNFRSLTDDNIKFYIDNQPVIINDTDHAPTWNTGSINLSKGLHRLKVYFKEGGGYWVNHFEWRLPGGAWQQIPPSNLLSSTNTPSVVGRGEAELTYLGVGGLDVWDEPYQSDSSWWTGYADRYMYTVPARKVLVVNKVLAQRNHFASGSQNYVAINGMLVHAVAPTTTKADTGDPLTAGPGTIDTSDVHYVFGPGETVVLGFPNYGFIEPALIGKVNWQHPQGEYGRRPDTLLSGFVADLELFQAIGAPPK